MDEGMSAKRIASGIIAEKMAKEVGAERIANRMITERADEGTNLEQRNCTNAHAFGGKLGHGKPVRGVAAFCIGVHCAVPHWHFTTM